MDPGGFKQSQMLIAERQRDALSLRVFVDDFIEFFIFSFS